MRVSDQGTQSQGDGKFGEGEGGAKGDRDRERNLERELKDERVTKTKLYQLHNFVSVLFMAAYGFMMGGI